MTKKIAASVHPGKELDFYRVPQYDFENPNSTLFERLHVKGYHGIGGYRIFTDRSSERQVPHLASVHTLTHTH